MLSTAALAKKSKPTLAAMVTKARNQIATIKEAGTEIAEKGMASSAAVGTFGLSYYVRRRLELKGKRVTFDKAGKLDAFLVTGIATMILGISPILGDAGKYVAQAGAGLASAGLVPVIDKMANEHHAAS